MTALDKNFKVWCKLKNKSACKVLQIGSAKLEMNLAELDEDDELNHLKSQIVKLLPLDLAGLTLDPNEEIECISENIKITSE